MHEMDKFRAAGILAMAGFNIEGVEDDPELIEELTKEPYSVVFDVETSLGHILIGKTIDEMPQRYRVDWWHTGCELTTNTEYPDPFSVCVPVEELDRLIARLRYLKSVMKVLAEIRSAA